MLRPECYTTECSKPRSTQQRWACMRMTPEEHAHTMCDDNNTKKQVPGYRLTLPFPHASNMRKPKTHRSCSRTFSQSPQRGTTRDTQTIVLSAVSATTHKKLSSLPSAQQHPGAKKGKKKKRARRRRYSIETLDPLTAPSTIQPSTTQRAQTFTHIEKHESRSFSGKNTYAHKQTDCVRRISPQKG